MGLWDRLRGRTETRDASANFAGAFGIHSTASGAYVNRRLAENLSTVLACVGAISSTLGTLPAYVYRRDAGGRVEAPQHPVARLIRQPNPRQSWPDFIEWLMASTLLHGNGIAVIESDGAGRPTGLLPVPWQNVSVVMLPSGRLAYDVVAYTSPWGGTGQPRRYLEGEVLHLKDRSDDGILGRSRIGRAPEVLGTASALQEWSGAMWRNQGTPSGALKVPGPLNQGQFDRLKAITRANLAGQHNARQIMILDNGAEWQSLSVSPEDAEVLASRRFSVEELCRVFQVPPPIVQDYTHNTFTNSQQAALWFAQFSLTPWVRKIEAEFTRSVFGGSSGYELEIDLSGLMRGDYAARWAAYAVAVQNNILDVNEIREAEGYNPRPAGASDAAP
jgi:HK97 family phage portal protein